MTQQMTDLDAIFKALSRSAFRNKFHLKGKELDYLRAKGLPLVIAHAGNFIAKRLAPAVIQNDGKQTPYRGHPVFIAQHATACCCRACLEKWHKIQQGRKLTRDEEIYIIKVLERWLRNELIKLP
jgi:hypothetical protein